MGFPPLHKPDSNSFVDIENIVEQICSQFKILTGFENFSNCAATLAIGNSRCVKGGEKQVDSFEGLPPIIMSIVHDGENILDRFEGFHSTIVLAIMIRML